MSATVVHAPRAGPLEWATTTDHKRLGLATAAASLLFFLASGVLALIMRSELASPGQQIVSRDHYNALFTMHGSGMIFLAVIPIAMAIGLLLVPLQVGAAEVAFPRAALFGFWAYILGGVTMDAGFLSDQGPGRSGWTAFYPLSGSQASPGSGMDLWILGVILATTGTFLTGLCVLATIFRLRAPGMTMFRMPVFTWTMAVTNVMVVVTFPVLVLAMSLLLADRLGAGIFNTSNGPAIYQNLFWFYGHPVVYVMFFPFVGAVAEVVAVFSRRRFFGYRMMVAGLLLFTALSMSVWAHHMFTTGQVANRFFALTSTALIVPAGIEYFDLIATMWGGSIRLATAMLFALGFLAQFVIGGVTGIIVASPPLDYHFEDSYFLVAHFHYTLFAGSLFGLFAGVYYWFPKWTGRLLGEGLGKVHFWMLVLGTNLTFFPMFFLGMDGMPRRVADYPSNAGWTGLNRVATVGAFIIATATLVFLVNVVRTLRRPADSPADPWAGHTLEWWTSSPPPRLNFESLPPIHSHAPLLDLRERPAHVP